MPVVRANGINIHYEEEGVGDPILLVMGLGGQLIDWPQPFVDQLVGLGFRVIRHDNRDIGLSDGFDWTPPPLRRQAAAMLTRRALSVGYTITDMGDDAAGLLDALGLESAHVVGVSMGGMIAQSLAIHHPAKVRSLCSIMSNTGDRRTGGIAPKVLAKLIRAKTPAVEDAPLYNTESYRMFAGSAWNFDTHLERAKRSVSRAYRPKGAARQAASVGGSPDRTEGLRSITVPTLVVHGLQDTLVLPSGGIATTKAVPGARLLMFPDMGHDLPASRIDEIARAVRENADRVARLPAI